MAISNEQLKAVYGMSDAELREMEESADAYDRGEWPEGRTSYFFVVTDLAFDPGY